MIEPREEKGERKLGRVLLFPLPSRRASSSSPTSTIPPLSIRRSLEALSLLSRMPSIPRSNGHHPASSSSSNPLSPAVAGSVELEDDETMEEEEETETSSRFPPASNEAEVDEIEEEEEEDEDDEDDSDEDEHLSPLHSESERVETSSFLLLLLLRHLLKLTPPFLVYISIQQSKSVSPLTLLSDTITFDTLRKPSSTRTLPRSPSMESRSMDGGRCISWRRTVRV